MPKKKKISKEQKIAESYFPIDESDLKYTIEKKEKSYDDLLLTKEIPVKEFKKELRGVEKPYTKPDKKSLEKIERIPQTKKLNKKKVAKFEPQKISLKKDGYELIITEKPQAASKIAYALGKPIQKNINKVYYYEVNKNNNKILVACAVGHLFSLRQNTNSKFPNFDISWAPNYLVRKNDFTKRYYDTLLKVARGAGSITVATDYDIEGELIGLNIVRFICNQEDASRMKFSTLTEKELRKAYEEKNLRINWGQAIAGETRHYLDWFYGINLSRALMKAIRTTGSFRIMSIGRVQGPALNLIIQKEREIKSFKSKPYWQIFIKVKNSHTVELKYNKDIFDKNQLEIFDGIVGKTAQAETIKKSQITPPNPPFNLTTLQTEAYKFYGISPSRTLRAAQSLYLGGLISYPRTSSQKLPASIDYRSILNELAEKYHVKDLITRKKPVEGKKSDPAHPSIYPTGLTQILTGDEEKIHDLIVRRFLSLFCEDAIIENKTIKAEVDGLVFSARGTSIKKSGWMKVYSSKLKEKELPDLNGKVKIIDSKIEEKETQPPKRYSQASIISELEKRNLGTKATRAMILETLYERGYIKEKSIEATPLGMSLITTLENYSPIIIDENLTRNLEEKMQGILKSKKGFEEKEKKVIEKAKETIEKISIDFEKNERQIGAELLNANIQLREEQKKENTINKCPVCEKGNLIITYSRKNKRHFVACDSYPECTNTYSLPPNGIIKKADKNCEQCNFSMLMRISKGKKPWIFCFNEKNHPDFKGFSQDKKSG